jgi:hypothetical protein
MHTESAQHLKLQDYFEKQAQEYAESLDVKSFSSPTPSSYTHKASIIEALLKQKLSPPDQKPSLTF